MRTDEKERAEERFEEVSYMVAQYTNKYQLFEGSVAKTKEFWMNHKFKGLFTGGLHSYNRLATINNYFLNLTPSLV